MKHGEGELIAHNKRRIFRTILASKFGFHSNAPSMPCVPVSTQECHREKHGTCGAAPCPALVTRLLDRGEWRHDPRAVEAVKKEGKALVDAGVWNQTTVTERADLVAQAKSSGRSIHMGNLMSICSIKFAEMEAKDLSLIHI